MKLFLPALLFLTQLLTVPLSAQPVITLTAAPVRMGGVATITVTLSGAAGAPPSAALAAVQWFFPARPGLIFPSPGAATTAAGKGLVCAPTNGRYGCIVSGGQTVLADGILATITLPAPASPDTFDLVGLLGCNAAGDSPGIAIVSGPPLTIVPINPCDLNGDGTITLLDARNLIDQIEGVLPGLSDLNGDGKTDVVDLQRVVNAIVDGVCRTGN